jgi:hypothetical protein
MRIALVILVKHIPAHILVAERRTVIISVGQHSTCYGLNETGQMYSACPRRRRASDLITKNNQTWTKVAVVGGRDSLMVAWGNGRRDGNSRAEDSLSENKRGPQ